MGVSALICAALLCGEVVSALGDRSYKDCITWTIVSFVVVGQVIVIVVAVVLFFLKRYFNTDRSYEDCMTWIIVGFIVGALVIATVAIFCIIINENIDKSYGDCMTCIIAALFVGALVMAAVVLFFIKRNGIIVSFSVMSDPKNLKVVEISTTSVKVQWEKARGEIDRYIVLVSPSQTNGSGLSREIQVPSGEDAAEIVHLDPGRLYIITLVAEKDGARSKLITVQATPGSKAGRSDSFSDSEDSSSTENITMSTDASHSEDPTESQSRAEL